MTPRQPSIFTRQPIKGIYALLAICFEAARVPFWLVKYLLPPFRQHTQWTYSQAVRVRLVRALVHHLSLIERQEPMSLQPGREKDRFVILEPGPQALYLGPLVSLNVVPTKIGGTWYPKPYTADGTGMICLHLHGGAFVTGDGRTLATGYLAKVLRKDGQLSQIFCPQYRLSSLPTNAPFPAALQDALSSYLYLTRTLSIPGSRIVVSGDSAGGNLAIALVRYLNEFGPDLGLPLPACALFFSPWVAPSECLEPGYATRNPNYATDICAAGFGTWGASCYIPDGAETARLTPPHTATPNSSNSNNNNSNSNHYIDLRHAPFKCAIPLWINVGGAEMLTPSCKEWAERMKGEPGNKIELDVTAGATHDIVLLGQALAFHEEAVTIGKRAGEFIRAVVAEAA